MSQPNALHKSMLRSNHLTVGQNRLGGAVLLLIVAVFGSAMLVLAFDLSILVDLGPDKRISSAQLKLLSALVLILLLVVGSGISIASRKPTKFRTQIYSFWPRILLNLLTALLLLLVSLTLLFMVYEYYLDEIVLEVNTPEEQKANSKVKVIAILLALGILVVGGLLIRWLGKVGFNNLSTYWKQVQLTGYFDQEDYQIGDQISFMLKDRQSLDGTRRYRVHLNFVTEEMQGSGKSKQIVRKIHHTSFQDLTAGELHLGVEFTLSTDKNPKWSYTNLSTKNLPQYWEILLEGEAPFFFARFFVNVVRPKVIR